MSVHDIELTVNGKRVRSQVAARTTLADFLREELGLTGTHLGCEHGVCGCCTVLLNGQAVRSCLIFAVQCDGCSVTTVEGLSGPDGRPSVLQEAFVQHHALQCGYCTPGMLMAAHELLSQNPSPSDEEIREALAANICRCTGYLQIIEAVRDAAARLQAEATGDRKGGSL